MNSKSNIVLYNNYHSSIKMTPFEALITKDEEKLQKLQKQNLEKIIKNNHIHISEFEIGEKVYIRNYVRVNKLNKKFIGPGKIHEKLENNNYIIKYKSRLFKRHWDQIKQLPHDNLFLLEEGDVADSSMSNSDNSDIG